MTKDPVCGMDIEKGKAAASSTHAGRTYYFCCDGCKEEFEANPEKYLGNA